MQEIPIISKFVWGDDKFEEETKGAAESNFEGARKMKTLNQRSKPTFEKKRETKAEGGESMGFSEETFLL